MNHPQHIPGFGAVPPLPHNQAAVEAGAPIKPSLWWLARFGLPAMLVGLAIVGVIASVGAYPLYSGDPVAGTALNAWGASLSVATLILILPCIGLRAHLLLSLLAGPIALVGLFAAIIVHGIAVDAGMLVVDMPGFGAASRPMGLILIAFVLLAGGILSAVDAYLAKPPQWAAWAGCSLMLFFLFVPAAYIFLQYRPRLYPKGSQVPMLGMACLVVSAGLGLLLGSIAVLGFVEPVPSVHAEPSSVRQTPTQPGPVPNRNEAAATPSVNANQYKSGPAASPDDFRIEYGTLDSLQTMNDLFMPPVFEITCRAEAPIAITGFAINGKAIPGDKLIKIVGGGITPYARVQIKAPIVMSIGDRLTLLEPRGGKELIYLDVYTSRGTIRYQFQ